MNDRPTSRLGRITFPILGALLGILCALIVTGEALTAELPPLEGRQNLALGRPVVFSPKPNYGLTGRGDSDATDLTDGRLTRREDRKTGCPKCEVQDLARRAESRPEQRTGEQDSHRLKRERNGGSGQRDGDAS